MLVKARYKHLDNDSKISGFGTLFRGRTTQSWSINLFLSGKEKKHINFSAAPILARRRVMNSTSEYKKEGKLQSFLIENAQNWKVGKLKDCPAYHKAPRGQDSNQMCFIADVKGKRFYIPQLEMARVLFYHDPFLARLSLQHNALSEDFHIVKSGEKTEINVVESAQYPLYYFNKVDNRRFLSWVLVDQYARKSFETISTNLFTQKNEVNGYDHWDFQFTPPPLAGVELAVSGWEDYSSNSFLVWEIERLDNLPSSISGEVDIIHPKFKRQTGGKPGSGKGGLSEPPEEYEIDDKEMSSVDKITMQLISESVSITFKTPFITNRISKNTKSASGAAGDKESLGKDLSVNEKDCTGDLPGGAWNNLDDQTDDTHLYIGKFKSFYDMVDILIAKHKCSLVSQRLIKLPKLGESKKHLLSDSQNPRCLSIVEITHKKQAYTLLEVDTSDGAAKLSTMLLKAEAGWVYSHIDVIKLGIMKKSLGWPSHTFQEDLGEKAYKGIPHPNSKQPGALPPEEIAPWAQRVLNYIFGQV